MKKGLRISGITVLVLILVVLIAVGLVTRSQSMQILYHPLEQRPELDETPEDYGMDFEYVSTTTEDGLKLFGWFIPGTSRATVMVQHGSPGGRQDGLYEAQVLNQSGFTVLLGSFRSHDECEGELISFGRHEQKDMAAWHKYLLNRKEVDPNRIGLFGESMGGGTSILYAADDSGVAALATGSAFALTQETIETFIQFELNPPRFLTSILARFIRFWVEREYGFSTEALDTETSIAEIRNMPVLIIHGGKDDKVGPSSGRQLYEAANEPKKLLWIEEAGHVDFEKHQPELYSQALVDFFNQHLLE